MSIDSCARNSCASRRPAFGFSASARAAIAGAIERYVTKLALMPQVMTREDVDALRDMGLSDRAVLEIVLVASYFCFVNRIVHALGVELEAYWTR